MYKKRFALRFFTFFACCFMVLLAACGQQSTTVANNHRPQPQPTQTSNQGDGQPQPTQTSNQGNSQQQAIQTLPMPTTQTACPVDGTARAAVMQPLALGTNQNLVYIYNEVPVNASTAYGHLKRYNLSTQQKTEIVTSGISIQSAQVSADGQWVLFLTTPDPRGDRQHSALLQLVRMDGQGLQTLYCFPAVTGGNQPSLNGPRVQWSVDQRSVLLSYSADNFTSIVTLLNVASGTLTPEIKYTDANQLYHYSIAFWLDNTHAYVEKSGHGAPVPPIELDLLNITTNNNLNGGDLTKVLDHNIRMSNLSFDSSYDGTQMFVSYCVLAASPVDSTITALPATGGPQHTIYHQAQTICTRDLRAVSDNTLLITVQTYNTTTLRTDRSQVWTMAFDGSNRKLLTDQPAADGTSMLNQSSQYPWSNLARDGKSYAIQSDGTSSKTAILIGSMAGGKLFSVADTVRGNVSLVGWTTM